MRMKRTTLNAVRLIAAWTLLLTGWFGSAISAGAQTVDADGNTSMGISAMTEGSQLTIGARFTVTTEDGAFLGACTLEGNPQDTSHLQFCSVRVPYGITVVVTEDISTIPPGYEPEENPVYFDTSTIDGSASFEGVVFNNVSRQGNASSGQTSNIAIVTTENGQPVTDVCYILVNFSEEGCDQNGDGKITFQDVPLGAYTVHQTANLGSGRSVGDFTIRVTGAASGDGWERFSATVSNSPSGSSGSSAPVDIALITRDPQDGHLLTGTCYVLVGFSEEGCDENGDGQVTFAAIPPGTYTIHQTRTPAGYPTINDYDIVVQNQFGVPLGFIVKQAAEQNAPNTRNVSVVFVNSRTYAKVSSSICVQFVGASDVGCDEDLIDGQIDFVDLPTGTHEIKYSNLPSGWQIMGQDVVAPTVTIDASPGAPTHQIIYVGVYVPDEMSTSTGMH